MTPAAPRQADKNWLEWVVFAVSLLVIAAIIGTLVVGVLSNKDSPARLEVFLGDVREERGAFVVPVVVQNTGGRAAAAVRVEVILEAGNFSERSGFDLSYSPAGSLRRGEVTFSRDPRQGTLKSRVPGFELP